MTNVYGQPVVVGVDGSDSALHAVRWAAREAERRGAPLRLLHATNLVPVRHPRQISPPAEYQNAVLEQGRHWLTEATEAALHVVPGLAVSTDLHAGLAADVLINETHTAQLAVLGSRGLGGFASLLVGSVAVALAAHGHCPVVVIHASTVDGAPPVDGPVVVGVDGSELSDGALTFAFEEAAARAVPLVAVHTWLDVNMAGAWAVLPGTIDWDWLQKEEEKLLAERLVAWREKFPQVEVRPVVVRDRPDHALLTHGAGAQLIVVGSRGRGAFAGIGLGSVSQSLLHHAECPVAVARTQVATGSVGGQENSEGGRS
ncbi:universal stress protein [Actinophytocola oryzae]|uniref:Nucleotide-binding universal stress UspA family protein n=1 Tax=Actinophytocola oryzae TaxID=502181 RepID=A0A4R7UZX3_9PSEU|nr:universal stress protein [Actinophytocola oryzae]TDV42533.1 nucleotide-binding universal stress UspA family protein [Actinophytocola oryzae]